MVILSYCFFDLTLKVCYFAARNALRNANQLGPDVQ
jgi:hypothetical protein